MDVVDIEHSLEQTGSDLARSLRRRGSIDTKVCVEGTAYHVEQDCCAVVVVDSAAEDPVADAQQGRQ